jgi:hypothetical protein
MTSAPGREAVAFNPETGTTAKEETVEKTVANLKEARAERQNQSGP